jgi:hypothetical protein
MNCSKCNGIGRYYTEEVGGVMVHPCSCQDSEVMRQIQEDEMKSFLERFEKACERVGYKRKQMYRAG